MSGIFMKQAKKKKKKGGGSPEETKEMVITFEGSTLFWFLCMFKFFHNKKFPNCKQQFIGIGKTKDYVPFLHIYFPNILQQTHITFKGKIVSRGWVA